VSFAGCGSAAGGAPVMSKVELHAISESESAAQIISVEINSARDGGRIRHLASRAAANTAPSCNAAVTAVSALRNLDLLGPADFEPGSITRFHPPTNPQAQILQFARVQPRRDQVTFATLGDCDGERLGPPSTEVDVNSTSALSHREHLSFDEGELTTVRQEVAQAVGAHNGIIRFRPQAKLSPACGLLGYEEFGDATRLRRVRSDAGETTRHHFLGC
jgi:hypothetical protein